MKKILLIVLLSLYSLLFCDEIDSLYYYDPDSLYDIGYVDNVSNIAVYYDMDENIEYDLLKLNIIFNLADGCQEWIYIHKNDSTNGPGTIIDSINCYFAEPDSHYYWYSRSFDLSSHEQLKNIHGDCWVSGGILMYTPGKLENSKGHTYAYWIPFKRWDNEAPDIPVKIIFNKREKSNAVEINNNSYSLASLNVFPNPFNSSTVIQFMLQQRVADCSLIIYDLKGNQVFSKNLNLNNSNSASIIWTPDHVLSSGVYFAMLKTDYEVLRQKMVYLK